jgi:hypothetical protein
MVGAKETTQNETRFPPSWDVHSCGWRQWAGQPNKCAMWKRQRKLMWLYVVCKKQCPEQAFLRWSISAEQVSWGREEIPRIGHSRCEGPEEGKCRACTRNSMRFLWPEKSERGECARWDPRGRPSVYSAESHGQGRHGHNTRKHDRMCAPQRDAKQWRS